MADLPDGLLDICFMFVCWRQAVKEQGAVFVADGRGCSRRGSVGGWWFVCRRVAGRRRV